MDCKKESTFPGYSVTDSSGKMTDATKRVIELVSDYSAILGACHLVGNDLFAVVKYANSVGAKTLIAHPFFMVPNLKVAEVKQLADLGAISELTAITVLAPVRQNPPPLQLVKEAVESIGADRFIISSDAGQPFCPTPVEALRVYAEALFELGVSKMDLKTMMVEIPEMLLTQ
jgi:hypothetical protein